jgi:GINS complex subunit 2
MSQIDLITGRCGPFRPLVKTQVPLWIALALKKHGKCTLLLPAWLEPDSLTTEVENEISRPDFSKLPFHWLEIASLILNA